jgi:hypothetical protein
MVTMILLLYLQQGLDVTLDQANLRGEYRTMEACEEQARKLRGPVPIPRDMQAAWQDAMCIKINNNVHVNDMKPVDLGKLLQQHPPLGCQAEGAWARVAEMCGSAAHDEQESQAPQAQAAPPSAKPEKPEKPDKPVKAPAHH